MLLEEDKADTFKNDASLPHYSYTVVYILMASAGV
jgi:hypothetical protein